jgi:hypothetical protein
MPMQTDYAITPDIAVEGQLCHEYSAAKIDSGFNAEASVPIYWGRGVKHGSTTDGKSAKLPAAQADKIWGYTVRSHSVGMGLREEADDTLGVKIGGQLNVLRVGTIWVKVHTGCNVGDGLYVRAVVTSGNWLGGAENAADSTNTIDCTSQATFRTFAAVDGLAKLECDFRNR